MDEQAAFIAAVEEGKEAAACGELIPHEAVFARIAATHGNKGGSPRENSANPIGQTAEGFACL